MGNPDKEKKDKITRELDLDKWIKSLETYQPTTWEQLPELELYMDQVVTFLNKQLTTFSVAGENLLTPSMVNNYVKDGVLPRPDKKKYSKNHLAMLMMICSLKSVLSLPEIHILLDGLTDQTVIKEQYPTFISVVEDSVKEMTDRLEDELDISEEERFRLALKLSLEANVRHTAASRILRSLTKAEEKKEG